MPSRPARLTDLSHPDAVHVVNQLFAEYAKRIDDVQKQATTKRISSQSALQFGPLVIVAGSPTGTIPANSCVESLVNLLGASTNLVAHANPTLTLGSVNLSWSAYVSAANQVKVRVCNPTAGAIVINTVKWNILVS